MLFSFYNIVKTDYSINRIIHLFFINHFIFHSKIKYNWNKINFIIKL